MKNQRVVFVGITNCHEVLLDSESELVSIPIICESHNTVGVVVSVCERARVFMVTFFGEIGVVVRIT